MQKMYKYSTSKKETFLFTSIKKAESFIDRHLKDPETAVYQGEVFVNKNNLEKIENGVYKS